MKGVIALLVLVVCLFVIVGVPWIAIGLLGPVGFWQVFATIVGVVFYESMVVPLSLVLGGGFITALFS